MDNINLLPEDLQKAEEKIMAAGSAPPPLNLYIPKDNPETRLPKKQAIEPMPQFNSLPKKIITEIKKPLIQATSVNPLSADKPRPSSLDAMDQEVFLKNQEKKKSFLDLFSSNKNKTKGKILKNKIDHSNISVASKPFNVNLIPEGSDLISNKKLYRYFLKRAIYAVIFVAGVYAGLFILGQVFVRQDHDLSEQLAIAEAKFKEVQKQNNSLINSTKQLAQLDSLFKAHIYWTKFFNALEKITIPQVYYNDINASLDGTVAISATADSYLSVAKQYLAYQNNPQAIKQVNISNLSGNQDEGVKFVIILEVNPGLFLNNQVKQ